MVQNAGSGVLTWQVERGMKGGPKIGCQVSISVVILTKKRKEAV